MKKYTREIVRRRKRRMDYRLRDRTRRPQPKPMLSASNIQYEMGDRLRGTTVGGIGAMHLLALRTGLIESIDSNVEVLKRHLPYHESDHVLSEDELRSLTEDLQWLKASEKSFEFWDNPEDAIYDTL